MIGLKKRDIKKALKTDGSRVHNLFKRALKYA